MIGWDEIFGCAQPIGVARFGGFQFDLSSRELRKGRIARARPIAANPSRCWSSRENWSDQPFKRLGMISRLLIVCACP